MTTAATSMDRQRLTPSAREPSAFRGPMPVGEPAGSPAVPGMTTSPRGSDAYAIARSLAELDPDCALRFAPAMLTPRRYVLANRFYAKAARTELRSGHRRYTWTWQLDPAPKRPRSAVELASPVGAFLLTLAGDHRLQDDWDVDWRPHTGDARLLAWTLYYEPVIVHLADTLGVDLEPIAILDMLDTRTDRIRVDFAIAQDDGEPVLRGSLFLPEAVGFATLPDLRGTPVVPPAIADVRVRLAVEIGRCVIDRAELTGLRTGDGIVVGSARLIDDEAPISLSSAGNSRADGLIERGGAAVRLTGRAVRPSTDTFTERRSTEMPDLVTTAVPPPSGSLDLTDVPVTLSFEAGSIELSVADLSTLNAGTVLVLDRRIAESPVTVRANGRIVARGEFVTVNDFLAVRITDTPAHGPQ